MGKPIYLIGGSKGGVGKSMVTMALIDYLTTAKDENVLLIETDTSNPDVYKTYGSETNGELVNLEEADGWMKLINLCADNTHGTSTVVVNTRASNNKGMEKYGENLSGALDELARPLVTLWVINRQRDSLELFMDYHQALPDGVVHIVRNGYFGDEAKYQLYNGSKLRSSIEKAGGRSLTFPDLADFLADDIYTNRMTIAQAARDLPIGNRAELKRWKALAGAMFDQVIAP
jgi:hypothetical protein